MLVALIASNHGDLTMRTIVCILAFLIIVGAANAGQLPRAVHEDGSCKLAAVANISESPIDFRAIEQQREQRSTKGRAPFKATPTGESTNDFCFWYKVIRYYTDATYTNQCGSRYYYCDGTVGTAGICNPPSSYYTVQENCDCE